MNVPIDQAGMLVFRDNVRQRGIAGGPNDRCAEVSADYCRKRERAERAAAKRATSLSARSVHQELAQHYARRARDLALR